MEAFAFLYRHQLSTDDIARLAGVTPATVRSWQQRDHIPRQARRLLELATTTERLWPGWTIRGESLYTPGGAEVPKGTIEALPILVELKNHLQRELRELRAAPVQYLVFPPE